LCRNDTCRDHITILLAYFSIFGGSNRKQIMKLGLLACLLLAIVSVNAQSLSTEAFVLKDGVTAMLSFDTPLFKSEKFDFAETAMLGIDYDGENAIVLSMSNFGYSWSPHFKSTAGAMYLGGDDIAPTVGFQAVAAKKNHFFMVFPTLTIQSDPTVWLISAAQFHKEMKKERTGILGITALQLFAEGGHAVTVGIVQLGIQKGKFAYGLSSFLTFAGKDFEFHGNPGIYMKYQIL